MSGCQVSGQLPPSTRRRGRCRVVSVIGAMALLAVAALVSGCASDPAPARTSLPDGLGSPVAHPVVDVDDDVFVPVEVVIEVGDEVTWQWVGRAAHNVVGDGFMSDVQVEGAFTHRFEETGAYPYVCTLHPGMEGTVYVVPAG